ncbi:hypothetical protein C0Q70_08263 [Pomacea canaliculata]|uniref:Uncharacterized protein n=1 Tax=Pomacea canaliculata TaxID=400727 RepID=A0A2T7PHB7_POMCA|nr:hypothetical protein C0Q70_08263 [Pomacea canaliculata]
MPPRAHKVDKREVNSTFFQTKKRQAKRSPVKTKRRPQKAGAIPSSWKLLSDSAKSFILRLFDDGIRLLMLKIPKRSSEKVHRVLTDARNRVAVNLETLKVPPGSHDYISDGSTLVKLRKKRKQLDRRLKSLEESVDLQSKLTESSNTYGMETSTDKSKIMVAGNSKAKIYMNGVWFEEVNSFKYLKAAFSKDGTSTRYPHQDCNSSNAKLDRV